MELFDELMAYKTVKRYSCSNCWGELEMLLEGDKYRVLCKSCGAETKGYVTQYFVTRRRAESEFECVNATHMLRKAGVLENPHAGKSTEQLLRELGF